MIAELGGPFNSDAATFPEFDFEWLSLNPVEGNEAVRVCNTCEADHIPSERYDAIFSVSVMEHVSEPWRAAEHMLRLVKPGGQHFLFRAILLFLSWRSGRFLAVHA